MSRSRPTDSLSPIMGERIAVRCRRVAAICFAIVALAVGGCAAGDEEVAESAACEWVGTVTTEGNVTTVRNEAGSVWCGDATLVEGLSIGVDAGEDPYMFGAINGLGVAVGRIFVLDPQVQVIRVYDFDGSHLLDIGRQGGGPGEFQRPTGLAVGRDGRLFVRDETQGRITVFSADGVVLDTWPMEPRGRRRTSLVVTPDGTLHVPWAGGMVARGPEGAAGDPLTPDLPRVTPPRFLFTLTTPIPGYSSGATIARNVPFWPAPHWSMAPDGSMISGVADRYRFERRAPDGRVIAIERIGERVAVRPAETEWFRNDVTAYFRELDPGWTWDQPDIPTTKPAFSGFIPALSGEIWVVRPGPGYEVADCEPSSALTGEGEPCWRERRIVDAFDAEGRFLGTVEVPDDWRLDPQPWIDGDSVFAVVENDAGTLMVKRYRVAPPVTSSP